jgi:predicted transcriptional regulator
MGRIESQIAFYTRALRCDAAMEYEYLHFPAEAVTVDRVRFGRLPESARRVFEVIKDQGPVTHKELRALTSIPPRTIRYAVKRLRDEGFVDTRCSLQDCRTCYFFVHKRCVGIDALEEARRKARQDALREGRTIEKF